MKKLSKSILILILCGALFALLPVSVVHADKNSPPDESIRDDETVVLQERINQLEAEKAAKERAAAEQRRRAADAKKRADTEKAAADKKRAEEERKLAAERAVRQAFEHGRGLVVDGRYHSGLVALRAYVKDHPHSAEAWYWIARAHQALGDYDRAQYATNIALEIDPYYPALTKTPNGLQPQPRLTKQQRKEPRPSMSVLPVKPVLPANLALEPVTISFPILREGARPPIPEDEQPDYNGYDPVTGAYLEYLPYPPMRSGRTVAWQQDEKFTEIGRWRFRVDRMGIMNDPRVPVAWKGGRPYEVYFWTGTEWARVRRQRVYFDYRHDYKDTMAHAQESIREVLDERGYSWNEYDTPALAASASHMRYMWIGDIDLEPAHDKAIKNAKERFVYDKWDELPEDRHRGDEHERSEREDTKDDDGCCGDSDDYY